MTLVSLQQVDLRYLLQPSSAPARRLCPSPHHVQCRCCKNKTNPISPTESMTTAVLETSVDMTNHTSFTRCPFTANVQINVIQLADALSSECGFFGIYGRLQSKEKVFGRVVSDFKYLTFQFVVYRTVALKQYQTCKSAVMLNIDTAVTAYEFWLQYIAILHPQSQAYNSTGSHFFIQPLHTILPWTICWF